MCLFSLFKALKSKNKSNNNCADLKNLNDSKNFKQKSYNSKSTETLNKNVNFFKKLFCCQRKKCYVKDTSKFELVQKQLTLCNKTPALSNDLNQNHLFTNEHNLSISEEILPESPRIANHRHADLLKQLKMIPYEQSTNDKILLKSKENFKEVMQSFTRETKVGYFSEKLIISSGTRSSVFYTKDNRIGGKPIALKQISLNLQREYQSIIEEVRFLFNKQVSHKNILAATECFLDCSFEKQKLYIAMEYVNGGCLRQLLTTNLTENQIAFIVQEVLCGLAFMHSNEYIHMDLTSENILFNFDGSVKIAGFSNIAKKNNDTFNSNFFRTVFYVSPEVARFILHKSEIFITGKIDIWALGIVLAEIIDGKPLFYNEIKQCKNELDIFLLIATSANLLPGSINHYSSEMKNFISLCLDTNEMSRASTNILREHQFINKAAMPSSLVPNIMQVRGMYKLP